MNLPCIADAYLLESDPTNNMGDGSYDYVGIEHLAFKRMNLLLRFDISGLATPPSLAILRAYAVGFSPNGVVCRLGRVNPVSPWDEGDGTRDQDVTWNQRKTGINWSTPGGDFVGPFRDVTLPSASGWFEVDVTDQLAAAMLDGTGLFEPAFEAPADSPLDESASFYPREYGDSAKLPHLVLTYGRS